MVAGEAPASAAVVFSDNFDSYSSASAVPWSGDGVWNTGDSVDLVKSGEYNITCAGGPGNCVDLSGDRAGSISKSLALLGSLVSLYYYLVVLRAIFVEDAASGEPMLIIPQSLQRIALTILAAAVVLLGTLPATLIARIVSSLE